MYAKASKKLEISGDRMSSQETGNTKTTNANADAEEQALFYHRYPRPGKLEIKPPNRWVTSAIWRLPIPPALPLLPCHS